MSNKDVLNEESSIEISESQNQEKKKSFQRPIKDTNNSKKVKEAYQKPYMHLIKPGFMNKDQIKKIMNNKQIQQQMKKEEENMNKYYKNFQKTNKNSKVNPKLKINGEQYEQENESKQEQSQNEIDYDQDQKKCQGRPKKKKNALAIKRTYGSVEQMIQKSINKQLALSEIKKQQRNLKLQKIDKKKLNELNVFQPSYLFDLIKEIQLTYQQLNNDENTQIIIKDLNELIFQNTFSTENQLNTLIKSSKTKKNQSKISEYDIDYIDDYPEIDNKNSFLLQPLQKQLQYVKDLETELGNEEIQGIGLRLAYTLKYLSLFVSKQFYQEMVYFMGYLLRVLSIKKVTQYQDALEEFLSIYEYIMNSIEYGGFIDKFPILQEFTDISKVYNLPKNIILSILKIIFKSNNVYSQNLQQQYNHQAQSSQF